MPFFSKKTKATSARPLQLIPTNYTSLPVDIPATFLTTPAPEGSTPITYTKIDFSRSPLPEYHGLYASVLDNVLTASECATLIQLAQSSSTADVKADANGWQPAMIAAGLGVEMLATNYRNSDRIIWDEGTVVQRLLDRCLQVEQARADLQALDERHEGVLGKRAAVELGQRWRLTRLNERMRFLRYGPGQFFKDHYDSTYTTPDGRERTFYTLHLYLNDSTSTPSPSHASHASHASHVSPLPSHTSSTSTNPLPQNPSLFALPPLTRGGATTFHSADLKRRLDVNPKAGRVLIFQHRGLLHSGDEVRQGVKYTMRTEVLFERCDGEEKVKGEDKRDNKEEDKRDNKEEDKVEDKVQDGELPGK